MSGVRLVLADRSATVRSVVRRLLGAFNAIEVVGETDDGQALVELVRRTRPDVLVVDLDLESLSGHDLIERAAEVRRTSIFALIPPLRNDTTRIAFAAHDLAQPKAGVQDVAGSHPRLRDPE